MTIAPLSGVIRQLRETALSHEDSAQTDAQLLEAFVNRGEEAAFESLLRRHGPMVLGVCRRVLHHAQDVEDSFQATFLVFVRKAASILPRDLVGNWLYGVAFRTALEARKRNARRRAKEREVEGVPKRELSTEDVWKELLPLLDQELNRLPDPYRLAIVLCDLEGKTHREAAQQLGWPQGTLSSRLVRGRVMLAKRLAKHGMVFSAGILSTMLAQNTVTASVPAPLILSTLEIARLAAAGQAALCGGVSTTVTTLAGAVQRGLWYTQVKQWSICLMLALSLAALGMGTAFYPAATATEKAPPPAQVQPVLHQEASRSEIVENSSLPSRKTALVDFTTIDVSSAIHATIKQGPSFRLILDGDEKQLQVREEGSLLKLAGVTSSKRIPARVTIIMPVLTSMILDNGATVTLEGFESGTPFQARLNKDCTLQGTLKASRVDMEIGGSGKVILKGSASQGTLAASGTAQLLLGDFSLERASVALTGRAIARLNIQDNLDYTLQGNSRLWFRGDAATGKRERFGAASVARE